MSPRQPHIAILTTAHPVDDVRVNHKWAQSFVTAGFRVTWIGPGHSYFDPKAVRDAGIAFQLIPPHKSRLDRIRARPLLRHLAAKTREVDVFLTPDPDSAELAVSVADASRARVIFDIHEVFHGPLLDRYLMGFSLRPVREYIRRRIAETCRKCHLVTGVSDAVLGPYVAAGPSALVVRSCAPRRLAPPEAADVCGADRSSFTVMHGKADAGRGTGAVLDAIAIARGRIPDLRVVMFSSGLQSSPSAQTSVRDTIQRRGLAQHVDLRPGIPTEEMPTTLRSCDAGIIAYGRKMGVDSLPNRLFEYMAAGLPVIAPAYASEIARIVMSERCGVLVDGENPESIADGLLSLVANPAEARRMGGRGREAFLLRHNWETEVLPVLDRIRTWSQVAKHSGPGAE